MENTLENKAKFFALYYGQEVLTRDDGFRKFWKLGSEVSIESSLSKYGYDYGYYLELTPLSQITDEDAIVCAKIAYVFDDTEAGKIAEKRCQTAENGKDWVIENETSLELGITDFLRSKGYTLPWLDTTVEQQIEFGWIKLKEN